MLAAYSLWERPIVTRQKEPGSEPSRAAKRARFAEPANRPRGASPLVLVAGLAVALLLLGGAVFALSRSGAANAAPVAAAAEIADSVPDTGPIAAPLVSAFGTQGLQVTAATSGHDPYPLAVAEDGTVRLALSTFDDYQAHFYTYMDEDRPIEFFVLKSSDGVVRAAFNACDVCFPARKGYSQAGEEMVCNNCGRRFPATQINEVQGGCNPSPLDRAVEGDTLIIQVDDLLGGQGYF